MLMFVGVHNFLWTKKKRFCLTKKIGIFMKKIIFSILIILVLLSISNNVVKSQPCPSGWNTKTFLINYSGCTYSVILCYECLVTHPGEVRVDLKHIQYVSGNCAPIQWDDAINFIRNYVSSAQFYYHELCLNIPKPEPCEGDTSKFLKATYRYDYCFEEYDGIDKVRPCESDSYCEVTYRYCFKSGEVNKYSTEAKPIGIIPTYKDCPLFGHHDLGECFMVHTPCNQ